MKEETNNTNFVLLFNRYETNLSIILDRGPCHALKIKR